MRNSPFLVNVAALRQRPGTRRREERRGPIEGLGVTGSAVPEGAEVIVETVLEAVPGAVIARGTVTAPWRGQCRRCLVETGGVLSIDVQEVFEDDHDPEETYPITGDRIDLEPLGRDAVLLELPQIPLCRELCLGLCPTCGAELNLGACACPTETADPRWAALDALREG
jgi:uncharacterized protein